MYSLKAAIDCPYGCLSWPGKMGQLSSAAKVDFNKQHAPLLIVASSADNIIPASLNKRNFKRYKQDNGSVTEFLEVADRNHHVLGLPTWQTDAQQILDWIQKN